MLRAVPASDRSLLVRCGDSKAPEAHRRVLALLAGLEAHPLPGLVDWSPSAAAILLRFDPLLVDHPAVEAHVLALDAGGLPQAGVAGRLVEIEVRYGGDHGPDLEDVARASGLSPAAVIALHASAPLDVLFLGFQPGFAYIGPMPEPLACPRLAQPRRAVPSGSVAVAGRMTAVYPSVSPGGWRLIGRTDARPFDPARRPMALLRAGDRVRFVPVAP